MSGSSLPGSHAPETSRVGGSTGGTVSFSTGALYAAGDLGPSLTSLCLAFYWLYFLIEVAALPALLAGLIHGSGYLFSAMASLWAGHWLDRQVHTAAARCRLIAWLGLGLAASFAALWYLPPLGKWVALWYLLMSWLFHLLFSLVYLAYLSLTALLSSSERERVDLSSFRFAGTMLLTLLVLGLHAATDGWLTLSQRLLALGLVVSLLAALGGLVCGRGLRAHLGTVLASNRDESSLPWRTLASSPLLWWAVGGNLAVWFVVQSALVLTVFLCASAGVSDALVLLIMQLCIVMAAVLCSVAARQVAAEHLLLAAALAWCLGALLWWRATAPLLAALLLGLGLGAGTVLSWARLPLALDRLAERLGSRADARAYAGLTVLRDLVSALVPLLPALALQSREVGSAASGQLAASLLIIAALGSALLLLMLQRLLPADAHRAPAPKQTA